MKYRFIAIACCLLVFALPLTGAQSSRGMSDPLSGTWTGELTLQGPPNPIRVTFELKFDGKSAVSGTFTGLQIPGDVKTGTFDPKTGALKMQLAQQGESNVRVTLDGTVIKGVASGKVTGEKTGEFKITKK